MSDADRRPSPEETLREILAWAEDPEHGQVWLIEKCRAALPPESPARAPVCNVCARSVVLEDAYVECPECFRPPPPPAVEETRRSWGRSAADKLAAEVNRLIERGVIGSRSPAADALLDYVDDGNPATSVPQKIAARAAAAEETHGERVAGFLRRVRDALFVSADSRWRGTAPSLEALGAEADALLRSSPAPAPECSGEVGGAEGGHQPPCPLTTDTERAVFLGFPAPPPPSQTALTCGVTATGFRCIKPSGHVGPHVVSAAEVGAAMFEPDPAPSDPEETP